MVAIRPVRATSSEPGLSRRLLDGGATFGKYSLIAKIGHGGMAEVFLVATRGPAGFRKLNVLKRLHPHLEDDESLVGMFLDEARLAARLNHPNVVQTFEVGEVEGLHFLTMEYLEGQSLARVLKHSRRLSESIPLAVGVRLFIEMLDGLEYAHTLRDFDGTPLRIVHRDISPGNIFVTYDGQVKLLDFGIARAATQLVETRAGQVKGKFAYIAPEQANPDVGHDQRADIWSLGVVMWEAFAGKRLFKGESEVMTLHNALNSQILRLDEESEVPHGLSMIVDRALQRDPALRYSSAREMREDLEAFMLQEGLRAGRNEVGTFVTELFERERDEQRRILSAYMCADLEAEPFLSTPSGAPRLDSLQTPPASLEHVDTERRPAWWVAALLVLLAVGAGGSVAYWLDTKGREETPATNGGDSLPRAAAPSQVPTPTGTTPSGTTPSGTTPSGTTPSGTTPSGTTPSGTTPSGTTPVGAPRTDGHRPTSMTRPTVTHQPEVTPTVVAPTPRPSETAHGFLTFDSVPWSEVSLDGRVLGTTPLVQQRLPEGEYVLRLSNSERGIQTTYRVTIQAGQVTVRRIAIQ